MGTAATRAAAYSCAHISAFLSFVLPRPDAEKPLKSQRQFIMGFQSPRLRSVLIFHCRRKLKPQIDISEVDKRRFQLLPAVSITSTAER